MGSEQADERQKEEAAEWDQLMQPHEMFVSKPSSRVTATRFTIHEARVTCIVECSEIGSHSSARLNSNIVRPRTADGAPQC